MAKAKVYLRKVPLDGPLTEKDLKKYSEIDVVVSVYLGDIINCGGIDDFNDMADEKVHDYGANVILADIHYNVVGFTPGEDHDYGSVLVRVRAQLDRD